MTTCSFDTRRLATLWLASAALLMAGCGDSGSRVGTGVLGSSSGGTTVGGETVEFVPPTAQQRPFDPAVELSNEMRQLQRQDEYLAPEYQVRLNQESMASTAENAAILANDPERNFLGNLCWTNGLPCAGDIRLYDWATHGYGQVEPVLFINRTGAVISGHVWATQAGPAKRPAVVITPGSAQATEQVLWWAAQTLAKAGYIVLTTDAQNQGRSDTLGEGSDAFEGVPPQIEGNTFYDGTVDAIDFMLSTAAQPYCPQPARSGGSHCAKQTRRATAGLNAAYNPFWDRVDPTRLGITGHSYGGQGASYIGQQDVRVKAVVAWDNLCHPDGEVGSSTDVYQNGRMPAKCQIGFQPPLPMLRTPALGISNDYLGGPQPSQPGHPLDKAEASIELSKAGVDTGEIVIRGGTHFEYSYVPLSGFPATKRGIDLAAWYTTAWFDKYLKQDPTADRRLLTTRWQHDAVDEQLDPAGKGNVLSFYYRSRLDIQHNGRRLICEDLEQGCSAMSADDGFDGEYSVLDIATSPDSANAP